MSQTPNNPFDQPQYQPPRQPQGSNTWVWVLGIIAGLFLLGSAVCCGVMWYASSQVSGFVAEAVAEEYSNNPVVMEHIGEVTEANMELGEAFSESSKDEDVAVMVFTLRGDKGRGKVVLKTNAETGTQSATLIMDSGEEFPLDIADNDIADDFDDFEPEMDEEPINGETPVDATESGEAAEPAT